jgi:hypothetical protein
MQHVLGLETDPADTSRSQLSRRVLRLYRQALRIAHQWRSETTFSSEQLLGS